MQIKDEIRSFILDNLSIFEEGFELQDHDNIFDKGFVDSLFCLKLIVHIEEQYGLKVRNEDLSLDNFQSIDQIVSFIQAQRQAG